MALSDHIRVPHDSSEADRLLLEGSPGQSKRASVSEQQLARRKAATAGLRAMARSVTALLLLISAIMITVAYAGSRYIDTARAMSIPIIWATWLAMWFAFIVENQVERLPNLKVCCPKCDSTVEVGLGEIHLLRPLIDGSISLSLLTVSIIAFISSSGYYAAGALITGGIFCIISAIVHMFLVLNYIPKISLTVNMTRYSETVPPTHPARQAAMSFYTDIEVPNERTGESNASV